MNLFKQANVIEKQAGDWSNVWAENLGLYGGSALGAIAGGALARKAGKGTGGMIAGALLGGLGPSVLGGLVGMLKKRRTPKEQELSDDSNAEAVKDLLIPGYAGYNRTRRALSKIDDAGTYNNVIGEELGGLAGTAMLPGSNVVGALAGLAMPTRSKAEQDAYDHSNAAMLLNALPGVSGYNKARRTKADYKDEDMQKESGFIQRLKELAFSPSPITRGINQLRTASTNAGKNIGNILKSLATTPSPITKGINQLRDTSLHTGKNIGELLKALLSR